MDKQEISIPLISSSCQLHPLRAVIVVIFALALAINALDRNLLAAVQPTLRDEFHLTNAHYGYLIAGFSISYGVSAPLMGLLLDRFGLTPVAVLAIGCWSVFGTATAFAPSLGVLLFCRILLGCAEGAALPAAGKAYAIYLRAPERSLGTAANQVGLTVGAVTATLLAGALTSKFGWRISFLVAGPLGLFWIPLWLWAARRFPASTLTRSVGRTSSFGWSLLKEPGIWALIMANLLTMPLYSLWTNWTTGYLVRERGLSEATANLQFAWVPPIFATLGGFFGGWLAMRGANGGRTTQESRFRVCLWAAVVLLLTAAIPYLPSASWATLGIGLSFFLTLAISVNVYAMALDLFGLDRAAFAFSLLTGIYGLMQAVISPLIGRWIDHHSFGAICIVGSITPLLGVAVLRLASLPLGRVVDIP